MSATELLDDLTQSLARATLLVSTSCASYEALLECVLTGRATITDAIAVAGCGLEAQRALNALCNRHWGALIGTWNGMVMTASTRFAIADGTLMSSASKHQKPPIAAKVTA